MRPGPVRRLEIVPPEGYRFSGRAALSPDGQSLVAAAAPLAENDQAAQSATQLFLRSMTSGEVTPIPGTSGAALPFFSPAGDWVGFFADGEVKKVSIQGGPAVSLGSARYPSEASWATDGKIFFQPTSEKTIGWVTDQQGSETTVIETPEDRPLGLDLPSALLEENALLLRVFQGRDESPLGILNLDTDELTVLPYRGFNARYVSTGHLVFLRGGSLVSVPFDLQRRAARGRETVVMDGVVAYTFSTDGTLVYTAGQVDDASVLTWLDRDGVAERSSVAAGDYRGFELSPDGKQVTVELGSAPISIWLFDLEGGARTRLTQDGDSGAVAWTPDSSRISFSSNRSGTTDLWWKEARASEPSEPLMVNERVPFWSSWSPNQRYLAFTEMGGADPDIFLMPQQGDREPQPFVATSYSEWGPAFSPDGRWVAYTSDESGVFEVYLQSLPELGGARHQISTGGGEEPVFSAQGDELFYRQKQSIQTVSLQLEPELVIGSTKRLFETEIMEVPGGSFGVSPDAQRFLVLQSGAEPRENGALRVVVNWFEELERLAPLDQEP